MKPMGYVSNPSHAIGTTVRLVVAMLVLAIGMVNPFVIEDAEAAPAAGTIIGNQASATYTDGTNVSRTATSNVVQTTVAQKASLTLTPANSLPGVSGSPVVFAHTLTNTGNGSDTFNLTGTNQGGDTFDFAPAGTPVTFFADTNGDGVADNATAITSTGPLAAGGIFRFVAQVTVPAAQANGATGIVQVTGASVFTPVVTDSKLDTVTVNSNTSISVIKSMSAISGAAGSGPYTVTLTYTNNGVATANAVTLTDAILNIPTGMTYVAGSGRWSVTGGTVLTDASAVDAQGTAPNTIIYDFNVTVGNRVTAVINQVPAGVSGTLTFQVAIGATAIGTLNNTATYQYNLGGPTFGPLNTNTVGFAVTSPTVTAVVVADDNPLQAGDLVLDDVVTVPSALQGATVTFNNRIHNNGTATDTFDITLSGSTFPAGTSFLLFQSDGVTPLTNSAGSGAPDTGTFRRATLDLCLSQRAPRGRQQRLHAAV